MVIALAANPLNTKHTIFYHDVALFMERYLLFGWGGRGAQYDLTEMHREDLATTGPREKNDRASMIQSHPLNILVKTTRD